MSTADDRADRIERAGTGDGERRSWLPRSLTARLVAGVLVIVLALMAVAGTATYLLLRTSLNNRLDQQLTETARTLQGQQLSNSPAAPGFRGPQNVWAVELDSATATVAGYFPAYTDRLLLDRADVTRFAAVSRTVTTTVTTTDGLELRVTAVHLDYELNGEPRSGVAVVGLSFNEIERTLGRLILLELVVGGGGAVIALGAGWWIVRLGLRPLHAVTRTAQEVATELRTEGTGLQRRVPDQDTVTEVGQLSESMNTLLAAAETQFAAQLASEARMRQFLADASHELRTPLTSIRGYAELARMQRRLPRLADGEAAAGDGSASVSGEPDNLDRIEAEGTRMSRLVEDLLVLARGDQGSTTTVGPVDIRDVLDDATAGARASYPARHMEYVAPEGLTVIGDHDQLLRVIRNLVTNAIVHTTGGIYLSATQEGDSVVIRVRDGGPGLPPEQAANVFERFWRADKSRARARGGSGLGMSIVASLVAAHGGSVDFSSSVEHGSIVTVRLPSA